MEIFFYFTLFILGTLFGSFSSVLITRWKNWKSWIILGRSACPKCNHTLWWSELIPVFSWVFQGGKCKNCKQKIPKIYPILEISMGIIFVAMWYAYLSFDPNIEHIQFLIILLVLGFFTGVYIFYDILYLEIPDEIFFFWVVWQIILFILAWFYWFEKVFFDHFNFQNFWNFTFSHIVAIITLYTFLFLQILIPGWIFLLKNKKFKDFLELFSLYFTFPFLVLYYFVKEKILWKKTQEQENTEDWEIPTWIWTGDLFLAIIIGWTLWITHGIVAFFLAYILWSIISIIILIYKNFTKQEKINQIAFGPFLGLWFLLSLIFHKEITIFINNFFVF